MNTGTVLIMVSLVLSLVSLYFLARGAAGNVMAKITARRIFYLSGISITFAVILLFFAFISQSFQFNYVYSYSSRELPLAYIIAGFWAGQEGTFLLWVFILYILGFFVIRSNDRDECLVMSIVTISQVFLLLVLVIYSPFRYLWQAHPERFAVGVIPPDGAGLNPLLQDPWMMAHPPVLFIGYAAATIIFAYAIAALLRNDFSTWVARSYRWTLFTMTSLGIGIFLGGYWAYKVLGWGGYWGWDPVENSSLIPWLVLVALMHGMIVQRRSGALVRTNIALALLSFILVFYSTFLTRSGVLSDFSVHSFSDLGLSRHLLFFMLFYVVIAAFLFAKRFRDMRSAKLGESAVAWDTLVAYGIITLCLYAFLILVGTSMPIVSSIFSAPFSLQPGYYNGISVPLGLLILGTIGLVGIFQFQKKPSKWKLAATGVAAVVLALLFNINHTAKAAAYAFSAAAFFVAILGVVDLLRLKPAAVLSSRLAHIGVAVMVLGIIASSLHSTTEHRELPLGKYTVIESTALTFRGLTDAEKSALAFTFARGRSVSEIETPYYMDGRTHSLYREPYISYGFAHDVYISPVEYRSGLDSLTRFVIEKGSTVESQGMKITFTGFDIDRQHMMAGGDMKLFAKLAFERGPHSASIRPGLELRGGDGRKSIAARIPFTGQEVRLLDFNVSDGTVHIFVEAPKGAAVPPDSAIVEVSFKRLIWFVWLGTIFIALGGAFAIRRAGGKGL
ncbi:MAG TPA: cytochrome c biogenesis protein CcsA [Spirochaetota bacterium]|nr:cytochrome c biogenesis protein CcsA [Spirochaetota bacterium]